MLRHYIYNTEDYGSFEEAKADRATSALYIENIDEDSLRHIILVTAARLGYFDAIELEIVEESEDD